MSRRLGIVVAATCCLIVTGCGGGSSPSATRQRPTETTAVAKTVVVSPTPWQLPAPVSREVLLTDGSRLLVFGGQDASHSSVATTIAVDPKSGGVTALGGLSPAVHDAAGARVGHEDLVIAGGSPPPCSTVQAVQTTGAPQQRGALPATRTDHVAAKIGTTIYVLGGAQDEGFPVASVFASSDAGATWRDAGTLAQPVRYPALAIVGDVVYLFGGVTTTDGTDTTAIQRYDPKTETTTVVGQVPAPLSHASAIVFGHVAFALGGYVNNTPSAQILRFDAGSGVVTQVGTLPAPLTDAAAAIVRGTGYLVGGEGPGRATTANVETLSVR